MEPIILSFGKYKSLPIEDVYKNDRDYLFWLSKQPTLNVSKEIADWLKGKFASADKSSVVNFGKYKGKTINHIWDTDKKYFEWLKSNDYVNSNMTELKSDIERLSLL